MEEVREIHICVAGADPDGYLSARQVTAMLEDYATKRGQGFGLVGMAERR